MKKPLIEGLFFGVEADLREGRRLSGLQYFAEGVYIGG